MLWIEGPNEALLVEGRGELTVMPADTAVMLHHIAKDTGSDCKVVTTWWRGYNVYACSHCSTVTSQCYGYRD